MESQEIFNTMMENAIVYLQEKGYIPTTPQMNVEQASETRETSKEKETAILIRAGLLPSKK